MRTIFTTIIISAFWCTSAMSQDYFPLSQGNKWTYVMSNGVEMTMEITGFAEINGVRCAIVESLAEGEAGTETSREYLAVDTEGLKVYMSQAQGQEIIFNPPVLRIKLPFKQGQVWTSTMNQEETAVTTSFEDVGSLELPTAAGNIKCILIRSKMRQPGQPAITSENYYSDGVGLVLQRIQIGNQTITTSLTSSKVKPTGKIEAPPKPLLSGELHCPNCNALVDANAKFCPQCGEEMKIPSADQTVLVDANAEATFEKYLSPSNKVMLYKPQNWKVIESRLRRDTNVISIVRPDDTALVVFITFPVEELINNSVQLAGACLNAFKNQIPDLEGDNIRSTVDKSLTMMDITFTEGQAEGVGHGYFFYTGRAGVVYFLLARDDMWAKLHPTLTNIASNIAYAPEGIEKVIKQGRNLAAKTKIPAQEHILNPAIIIQKAGKSPVKQMQLIPSALEDKSLTLQIPQNWRLEGQESLYFLLNDPNTKTQGMTSGLHNVIQADLTIPGILNRPYQSPPQALNLILEYNRIGKDFEILAELPAEQADPEIAKAAKISRSHGLQVDSRLIHAIFKSISSPQQALRGIFSVQCIAQSMSSEWNVIIDGAWAPDKEFDEWLPLYLQIGKTIKIDSKDGQDEQQNKFVQQQELNRKLQNSIADSNHVFEEYIDNIQKTVRTMDYTGWIFSQTTLGHGTWAALNEGAEVYQANSWGIESEDDASPAYNTTRFTGVSPWTQDDLELTDTSSEFEKLIE